MLPSLLWIIFVLPTLALSMTRDIEDAVCKTHLELYRNSIGTEFWAMRMFDSSTKIPEGFTTGQKMNLGNFDNCIEIDQKLFTGKYCLASISFNKSIPSVYHGMINTDWGLSLNFTQMNMTDDRISSKTILELLNMEIAVCVPSSCDASDIEIFLNAITNKLQLMATVSDENCQVNESKQLRPSDWVGVVVFAIFVLLIIASSVYDLVTPEGRRHKLLLAFSAITNGRGVLATCSSSDTLGAVNGIRAISICVVVLAHRHGLYRAVPLVNDDASVREDWKKLFVSVGSFAVDTFLVLSGMLVSYIFFKEVKKTERFNVFKFYVHRYVRLTPVLMAMMLFQATFLQYMGSGPLWERLINVERDICESNWWLNLLYVQNYVPSAYVCLGQTWYLAVDMQLYILAPLILIPLWKKPKLGCALLALLMLIGWAIIFTIVYNMELYPIINETMDPDDMQEAMKGHYLPTYARYIPWLMGVGLGFILHHVKNEDLKIELSKMQVGLGWIISVVLMIAARLLAAPYERGEWTYNVVEAAFYVSLSRPAFALGVSWVVLACATGYGGPVDVFLSWEAFQPLSKISYSIYLAHFSVEYIITAATRTARYYSISVLIPAFFGDLVISSAVAFVLTITFESPFRIIEGALFRRRK